MVHLSNLTKPDLHLSVLANLSLEELDRYAKINQNLSGVVNFKGTVAGPIPDITASGHLTCWKGTAWELAFENVSSDVQYQGQQVAISHLEMDIFDGRATGDGTFSFAGPF